jgi:hypothetical protein
MLNLKGVICGTVLFAFAELAYLFFQFKRLSDSIPRPPGTQVGIDIGSILSVVVRNPMFWIVFVACITLSSFFFRTPKDASL